MHVSHFQQAVMTRTHLCHIKNHTSSAHGLKTTDMDDTVSHAFTVCVVFPGNTAASSTEGYWRFGSVVLLNVLRCPLTY